MSNTLFPIAHEATDAGPAPAEKPTFEGFHIQQHSMTANFALQAGVPGIIQADVDAKKSVLVYELMLDSKDKTTIASDGDITISRYSAGVRIVLKVTKRGADFNLNLTSVSLATSAKMAETELKTKTKGFPAGAGDIKNLPTTVLSDDDGYEKVIAYIKKLQAWMVKNPTKLFAEPHTVFIGNRADTPEERAQAVVFTMRQILKRVPMDEALDDIGDLDPDVVRAVYQEVTGNLVGNKRPSKKHKNAARDWLSIGKKASPWGPSPLGF